MRFDCRGFSVGLRYKEERLAPAGDGAEAIGRARRVRLEELRYNGKPIPRERAEKAHRLFADVASINSLKATCYRQQATIVVEGVSRRELVRFVQRPAEGPPRRFFAQLQVAPHGVISADPPDRP